MLNEDGHGCGSIGRWIAFLFAALGVVAAIVMVRALRIPQFVVPLNAPTKEMIVGLIALFVAASWLGKKAGTYLCDKTHDTAMNVLVGLGVAFGSISISVMTGTFLGVVSEAPQIFSSVDFNPLYALLGFFIPLLIVLFFGAIPAILLGVLYGFLIRNRLRKLNA
ncbi:MAG TPA: hypothetical protein VJM12_10265 [Pyrinomonadaceae bacterium]|nr:hypothetical protein [Pyrinomonadaceae bacterium]